jgi:hypothetical protein
MAAAATARTAPAPRTAPVRRRRPARVAPPRPRTPARRRHAQLLPLAVGTATAVGRLPDSGLIVRLTRGRVWIGVLGVLLTGIVALNVVTLSLTATSSRIEQNIQALEEENSLLRSRDAQKSASERVRHDAGALGLTVPTIDQVSSAQATPRDAAIAARRLEAAESGH